MKAQNSETRIPSFCLHRDGIEVEWWCRCILYQWRLLALYLRVLTIIISEKTWLFGRGNGPRTVGLDSLQNSLELLFVRGKCSIDRGR